MPFMKSITFDSVASMACLGARVPGRSAPSCLTKESILTSAASSARRGRDRPPRGGSAPPACQIDHHVASMASTEGVIRAQVPTKARAAATEASNSEHTSSISGRAAALRQHLLLQFKCQSVTSNAVQDAQSSLMLGEQREAGTSTRHTGKLSPRSGTG